MNVFGTRFSPYRGATILVGCSLLASCGDPGPVEPMDSASPLRVRLLTAEQYRNTVSQIFGDDVAESVIAPVPPLTRTDGLLASGASAVGVTSDQIQQIQQAATTIAARIVDEQHRSFLIPCEPVELDEPDAACAAEFLRATGRLLYRRSPDENTVANLVEIAVEAAAESDDFYVGLSLALESMLISPNFLFIADVAEPDPEQLGARRLDGYSLASRLSYFLWNSAPDDALLLAAETGQLHTDAGLAAEVERMLTSSRLEDGIRAFFDDMMAFDEFDSLAKDPVVYPMVTGATLADAREQTLLTIVDHLLDEARDYRDLFTTRDTFMSMNLGPVYGVPATSEWSEFEFPEDGLRQGVLTQVSFLAAHSHSVRSSATLRGRALRELFLCQKVPDPPPNVDFTALEEAGDVPTARERLIVHNENPSCAGCHLITDPIGLTLENFDGAGRFRVTENGAPIDTTGELDGARYGDAPGLAVALRDHPKLPRCLVQRIYAYGTGGPITLKYDRDIVNYLTERFANDGYVVPELLREIVLSRAFTRVRPTEPTAVVTRTTSREEPAPQPIR